MIVGLVTSPVTRLASFICKLPTKETMSKPVFEDLFKFSGRRNRESFIKFEGLLLLFVFSPFALIFLAIALNYDYEDIGFILTIFSFGILLLAFLHLVVIAQRVRDIGLPGFLGVVFILGLSALAVLIPTLSGICQIIFFVSIIVLACVPGEHGENKYGPDPLKF